MNNDMQVMLLADKPAEENSETVRATANLIRSARDNKIVAIVCTHATLGHEGTILCTMEEGPEPDTAQYVPLALLFTPGNTPWQEYLPPDCATGDPSESKSN